MKKSTSVRRNCGGDAVEHEHEEEPPEERIARAAATRVGAKRLPRRGSDGRGARCRASM